MAKQLDLFSAAEIKPRGDYTTEEIVRDGVRYVRVTLHVEPGGVVEEPLHSGPLTYGECQSWESPCRLYRCRHRLDQSIEIRTRRPWEPDEQRAMDECGFPILDEEGDAVLYKGPRAKTGAFWSSTPLGPGDWCALRVAERGGMSLEDYGDAHNSTREWARKEVEPILDRLYLGEGQRGTEDVDLEEQYGDRGRLHSFKFEEIDDNVTSTEVKRLQVPGEVKRGRVAPRITGRRRSRKDQWAGVTRVIPGHLADRVDERLMNPIGPRAEIPAQFMKPMAPPGRKQAA